MSEQEVPTFKLVLVGDGGTGKVCVFFLVFFVFLIDFLFLCVIFFFFGIWIGNEQCLISYDQ